MNVFHKTQTFSSNTKENFVKILLETYPSMMLEIIDGVRSSLKEKNLWTQGGFYKREMAFVSVRINSFYKFKIPQEHIVGCLWCLTFFFKQSFDFSRTCCLYILWVWHRENCYSMMGTRWSDRKWGVWVGSCVSFRKMEMDKHRRRNTGSLTMKYFELAQRFPCVILLGKESDGRL